MKVQAFILAFALAGTSVYAQELTFAMGSCAELSDRESELIFTQIEARKPDFFLWLGDNTYYTNGEWNDSIRMAENWRRRHSSPPLAQMMESISQRAIWDDHDFGPNDADSTYALKGVSAKIFSSVFKETPFSLAEFGDLRWQERKGKVLFIGLDDRTHRGPVGTQVLGIGQLDWISEVLKAHRDAPLVFVALGSQVLNLYESFENMARYPDERIELLKRCAQFPGQVVFLTGDRHHGEIEEVTFQGKHFIEVCSSPLTSKVFAPSSLEASANTTIRGNPVNQKHFTVIKVSKKKLDIEYCTSKGETIVNASYDL